MRTTLTIDDDVLLAAKAMALIAARNPGLGSHRPEAVLEGGALERRLAIYPMRVYMPMASM